MKKLKKWQSKVLAIKQKRPFQSHGKILYIFLLVFLFFPTLSKAQNLSFEAYIDRETVSVGETFQIKLELINAVPESTPDLSVLPKELTVASQQKQQNVNYVEGVQSQNNSWILDIVSEKEGTYKIPSIEVKTNAGELYTKPFRIYVKTASQISSGTTDNSVFIEAQIEGTTPYIDEPVLYKTAVYNLGDINQAELVKPKVENATIEQISDPKPSRQILNGVNYKMIEVEYIITPLKEGALTIEPTLLKGQIAKEDEHPKTALDDIFAPFGGANIMKAKQFTPFTVASKKINLNVKAPEVSVNPWLVLYDLKIDDEVPEVKIDEATKKIAANAGEPITRKIRLTAYGKGGAALPEIEDAFKSSDFKIYADKPEINREIISGEGVISSRVKGSKTQTFTFIPQRAGQLILPELNITYWSLKENKPITVTLPGKEIVVSGILPQAGVMETATEKKSDLLSKADVPEKAIKSESNLEVDNNVKEEISNLSGPQKSNLAILIIALSIVMIMFISFKALLSKKSESGEFDKDFKAEKHTKEPSLAKGLSSMAMMSSNKKPITGPVKNRMINFGKKADSATGNFSYLVGEATSYKDLLITLQKFAESNLQMPKNSASILIAKEMIGKYLVKKDVILDLVTRLDSAIYAGKQVDLKELKKNFYEVFLQIENKNFIPEDENDDGSSGLIALNP